MSYHYNSASMLTFVMVSFSCEKCSNYIKGVFCPKGKGQFFTLFPLQHLGVFPTQAFCLYTDCGILLCKEFLIQENIPTCLTLHMLEEVFAVATEKYLFIEETVSKIRIKEDKMCEKTKQNQAKIKIALLEWQQASVDDV